MDAFAIIVAFLCLFLMLLAIYCRQTARIKRRDLFAAHAMHAELVSINVPGEACDAFLHAAEEDGHDIEERVAMLAYRMADAMMNERQGSIIAFAKDDKL